MVKNRYRHTLRWAAICLACSGLVGCAVPSAPRVFSSQSSVQTATPEEVQSVATAFRFTQQTVNKFWFNGSLQTTIQGHSVTSYFEGEKDFGNKWLVDTTAPGTHVTVATIGSETYERTDTSSWHKATYQPADPLAGFTQLGEEIGRLPGQKLPDETIVGLACSVYRFTLPSSSGVTPSSAMGFVPNAEVIAADSVQPIRRTMTVWVAKQKPYICQVRFETIATAAQLGAAVQDYTMQMYDFNTPRMQMVEFQQILNQIHGKPDPVP